MFQLLIWALVLRFFKTLSLSLSNVVVIFFIVFFNFFFFLVSLQTMAWILDEYSKFHGYSPAVVTGKPIVSSCNHGLVLLSLVFI